MKKLKSKIEFTWWRTDKKKEIPEDHQEQLKQSARDRINEIQKDGYVEGQLLDTIDGVEYQGWWTSN